jgi:hypothetical protein
MELEGGEVKDDLLVALAIEKWSKQPSQSYFATATQKIAKSGVNKTYEGCNFI